MTSPSPSSPLFDQIEAAAHTEFPGEPVEIDVPPTDWGTGEEEFSVLVGARRARCYQARVDGPGQIRLVRTS